MSNVKVIDVDVVCRLVLLLVQNAGRLYTAVDNANKKIGRYINLNVKPFSKPTKTST
jgi:hypothetical protein